MRLFSGLLLAAVLGLAISEEIVCYFSSWAVWRPGDGKFDVENVDPFLCTQLIFGFTGLSNHTWEIEVLDPWNELCPDEEGGNNCAFDRFVALKQINPKVKILLAVGGWNEGSEDYSVMSADPEKRKTFVDSTVELLLKHQFEGFDMDWEYPGNRGGAPEDKENFIVLLRELREAFDAVDPTLMLTAAVAGGRPTIEKAYDIRAMAELLDQINLMTYDYHGAFENFTGHNAPLCGHYLYNDDEILKDFNVMYTVNYYLQAGVPPEKLIMGIPTYGRCFTLDDINDHGLLAPAQKPGPAGPYIRIPGTLGFNEICERLQSMDCTIVRDPCLYEPYFYCQKDKIWCGFDDAESVYTKARYAKNMGLGGILTWTIDTDDFHPRCYDEPFHLIESMKRAVNSPADGVLPECTCLEPPISTSVITTPTPEPTTTPQPTSTPKPTTTPEPITTPKITTTPEPITTPKITTTHEISTTPKPITTPPTTPLPTTTPKLTTTPKSPTPLSSTTPMPTPMTTTAHGGRPKPDCSNYVDGSVFPHEDCNKYWVCTNGQAILELCAPGTLFDVDLSICNWEDAVDTSDCRMWICEVDNTYYPHVDCDKYYWCYQGSPHLEVCPNGLFWNQYLTMCDMPIHVDTSECNIPL